MDVKFKKILLNFTRLLKKHKLIIFVLGISAFFRFYNVLNRYTLGAESIRDANVAIIGSKTFQLPITGPFSSLGPFTFGPWYWYQLILFHLILPISYSSWVLLGIVSLLFVFVMYRIGLILDGKRLGITLAILSSLSPYLVSWSTLLTNPGFIFIFAALSIYIFLKLINDKANHFWGFLLGSSIGIGINIHYQMVPYILLIFFLIINRKRIIHFILAVLGLIITFLPLLKFELLSNWHMSRMILNSYLTIGDRIYVPNSWRLYLLDFWPHAWSSTLGVPVLLALVILLAVLISFVKLTVEKKWNKNLFLLSVFFAITVLQLRYYGGERSLSYIHYLMPLILIYTAFGISYLYKIKNGKVICTLLIAIILLFAIPSSINKLFEKPISNNKSIYKSANYIDSKFENEKISLYHCKADDPGYIMSVLFILDSRKKIAKTGHKLSLAKSTCEINASRVFENTPWQFVKTPGTAFIDLSSFDDKTLSKMGWKPYTMESLYEDSVFWWKKEKL